MEKALAVLLRVIIVITCFDFFIWIGDRYWRTAGETAMKTAKAIEVKRSATERALENTAQAVNAFIREERKIPKRISDVMRNGYRPTDGWGNKLRLEKTDGGVRVASAGPDGDFETEDDNIYSEPQNGLK